MARIIPFETLDARIVRLAQEAPRDDTPMTPEERNKQSEEHALGACRTLLTYFKKTGRWTEDCERQMVTAVRSIKTICRQLALTENSNETHTG
jgi:hypothetical protein